MGRFRYILKAGPTAFGARWDVETGGREEARMIPRLWPQHQEGWWCYFRAKDYWRKGRFGKEGLGADRCHKANFFGFI